MKELDLSKLPDQTGRHILITGGTSGLGKEMTERLAGFNPAVVVFTGRNKSRGDAVVKQIKEKYPKVDVEFQQVDLASLDDIQKAKPALLAKLQGRLDVLICNAGIMAVGPALSKDGYEIQFATNHVGHAALIKVLLPTLTSTAEAHGDARVDILTSEGLMLAPNNSIPFKDLKTTQDSGFNFMAKWKRYGASKLANALYAQELAKHHPKVSFVSIHPGVIGTDLVKTLGFLDRMMVYATSSLMTLEQGCMNPLWGATAPRSSLVNGGYYQPVGEEGKKTPGLENKALAEELWTWTEKALQNIN